MGTLVVLNDMDSHGVQVCGKWGSPESRGLEAKFQVTEKNPNPDMKMVGAFIKYVWNPKRQI